jgi:hypothetical protein
VLSKRRERSGKSFIYIQCAGRMDTETKKSSLDDFLRTARLLSSVDHGSWRARSCVHT